MFAWGACLMITLASCRGKQEEAFTVKKGGVVYDFSFAELGIRYLESGDTAYLPRIAALEATRHLFAHANHFDYSIPHATRLELVKSLLNPIGEKREALPGIRQNLAYARKELAMTDLPQKVCLQYLPDTFHYASHLYFTIGYDIGVVYGNNASLNLANSYFLEHPHEIRYYAIHELHHAGLVTLKHNRMPSIGISTCREMTGLIDYFTQLEGMGTYAPLAIREKEHAMDVDKDYIALQDSLLMDQYTKEYFEIYSHFRDHPDSLLTEEDWGLLSVLSDEKRLWYRVGARIAETIDTELGREKLVSLIPGPAGDFIQTFLELEPLPAKDPEETAK